MKKIFLIIFLLAFGWLTGFTQPIKRIIQMKAYKGASNPILIYYNTDFESVFIRFPSSSVRDTITTKEITLDAGRVVQYSFNNKNTLYRQHFIIPSNIDTIKLEIGEDYSLHLKGGPKFFVEDVIDILADNPLIFKPLNHQNFLDKAVGLDIIKRLLIYNNHSIDSLQNRGICSKSEYNQLLSIARTDYYVRLLYWAEKNKSFELITDEMNELVTEKERIQSTDYPGIQQAFSMYIRYLISRDYMNTSDISGMTRMIIGLGWHKDITSAYLSYQLEDLRKEPAEMLKVFRQIKDYLGGAHHKTLNAIAVRILPKFVNTETSMLMMPSGKQLSFKELLTNNQNKYIIIDFWASWCAPCREEAPYFEQAKQKIGGNNIVFVSVSLDEDNKVGAWKAALKEGGFAETAHQYKIMGAGKSPLFEKFKITQIPRYVLMTTKGEMIDSDFLMPSNPRFIEELSRLTNK